MRTLLYAALAAALAIPAAAFGQDCALYPPPATWEPDGYGVENCTGGLNDVCEMGVGSETAEQPIGPDGTVAWTEPASCLTETAYDDPPSAAPEIDPGGAIAGLTVLLGALAVLRGRRPVCRSKVGA